MGKRILLAEDDTNLRETLTEALRAEGIDVVPAVNGANAIDQWDACQNDPPCVIVLDALMPKMTGFDVAKALRGKGVEVPIVFISGVYKSQAQADDAREKYGAKAYLVKPFEPARLVDTIKPLLFAAGGASVQAAPLPSEGTLLENPVLYLLWRAQREMHSGILELFSAVPGERARVFVYKGRGVFAQHSDPQLNVGVELVREGVINAESYKQALELAVQRGLGLFDVIKAEGWANEAQMRAAYKALMPKVLERIVAMVGRFRWVQNDQFTSIVPGATGPLLDALLAGLRKTGERDLEVHVNPRRPLRLAPGDCWAEVAPRLVEACGSDSLVRVINGRATIAQMLEAAPNSAERNARYRQVYLLMSTMAVRASTDVIPMLATAAGHTGSHSTVPPPEAADRAEAEERSEQPSAPSRPTFTKVSPQTPSGPPRSSAAGVPKASSNVGALSKPTIDTRVDATLTFSPEDIEARRKIDQMFEEIDGKDYFAILRVPRNADAAAVKKAYLLLARDFHTDAFAGRQLGSAQQKLDHIFQCIQTAYSTLIDEKKRGEYEAQLQFEAEGASTDIAAIMQAENDLEKALRLIESNNIVAALKLIDKVVPIMPNDPSVIGARKYCQWWQTKTVPGANDTCRVLEEQFKKAPGALHLKEFQGWIWMEINELQRAKSAFSRVLEANGNHAGAMRGMRALQRKLEEQKKQQSSGLGKFLKR